MTTETANQRSEVRSTDKRFVDPFGRRIEYLRLSITDLCDLRCAYCRLRGDREFVEPSDWLTFEEIERVVRVFAGLGVRRVRLTGGEPLTRHRLAELAARLHALPGLEDLSLSTNGVQLRRHARALRQAGVQRVNVGLASLRPERFAAITGGRLDKVLEGLAAAREAGMHPIKINMVAMKGVNDDEIEDMVWFCIERGFTLRLIETMPVGAAGRSTATEHYLDLQAVRRRLARTFDLTPAAMPGGGPARYLQIAGTDFKIGFITPISQHFCETCNRVRVAADGALYLCLGQNDKFELRPLLRQGIGDAELAQALQAAIARKPERHEFQEQPQKIVRVMASTGG